MLNDVVSLAALLIEQKMKGLRIKARIGVTTGRVYIGVVGAAGSASEYGILGDQGGRGVKAGESQGPQPGMQAQCAQCCDVPVIFVVF